MLILNSYNLHPAEPVLPQYNVAFKGNAGVAYSCETAEET